MTFLRPEALLLIPGVLLLVLILGRFRRRRRMVVPSLRILNQALERNRRFKLFRNPRLLWSEILALLALIALAMAAARPAREELREKAEVIYVLCDLSPSLSAKGEGGTRFEVGKRRLWDALRRRGGRDRYVVIAPDPDGEASVLLSRTADRVRLRETLDWLTPFSYPVGFDRVLALARTLVEKDGARVVLDEAGQEEVLDSRVILLSDRDPSVLLDPERWPEGCEPGLVPLSASAPTGNVGLVRFERDEKRGGEDGEERDTVLGYTVFNASEEERKVTVNETIGDEVSPREVTIAGRASVAGSLVVSAEFEGAVEVSLEPGDDFEADDRVMARVASFRKKTVAVISDAGEIDPFLTAALLACGGWVDTERTLRGKVDAVEELAAAADLMIFDRVSPPPGTSLSSPSLWLAVENPTLPLRTGAVASEPHPSGVTAEHPLLEGLRFDHLHVGEALEIEVDPGVTPVLDGIPGPLLVAGEGSGGPFVYLAFHPTRSSLPYVSTYPLLVRNTLRWFFGSARSRVSRIVPTGTRIEAVAGRDEISAVRLREAAPGSWLDPARNDAVPAHWSRDRFFRPGSFEVTTRVGEQPASVNFLHPAVTEAILPVEAVEDEKFLVSTEVVDLNELSRWWALVGVALLVGDWLLVYGVGGVRGGSRNRAAASA